MSITRCLSAAQASFYSSPTIRTITSGISSAALGALNAMAPRGTNRRYLLTRAAQGAGICVIVGIPAKLVGHFLLAKGSGASEGGRSDYSWADEVFVGAVVGGSAIVLVGLGGLVVIKTVQAAEAYVQNLRRTIADERETFQQEEKESLIST